MCGAEIQGIDILTSVSPRAIQTEPHYNNLRSSNKFLGDSGEGTRKTSGDRGGGGEGSDNLWGKRMSFGICYISEMI